MNGASHTNGNGRYAGDGEAKQAFLDYRENGADAEAFNHVVAVYRDALVHYLRSILGDANDAEDVVQEVLLQAAQKAAQFDPAQRLRPWMYTIAQNKAVDLMRKRRRHSASSLDQPVEDIDPASEPHSIGSLLLDEDTPDPGELIAERDMHDVVLEMLDSLSPDLKEVVILTHLRGMKYREAADTIGIPMGTVKSRLHVAMVKLREMVTERALEA